jgi:hypothetical protein
MRTRHHSAIRARAGNLKEHLASCWPPKNQRDFPRVTGFLGWHLQQVFLTIRHPRKDTLSRKWCCVRGVHESIIFNRLDLALSEKQIPRFVVNVSSQRKRNELLEAIVRLCKQGVIGSIPIAFTNNLIANHCIFSN